MNSLIHFVEGYWWLAFIFGGGVAASVREAFQRHHKRRIEMLQAKAEARKIPVEAGPQPVCGCSHHLSFHSPTTSACAYEGCRCQQYVGPEPLGHVFPMPLVDPDAMGTEGTASP